MDGGVNCILIKSRAQAKAKKKKNTYFQIANSLLELNSYKQLVKLGQKCIEEDHGKSFKLPTLDFTFICFIDIPSTSIPTE